MSYSLDQIELDLYSDKLSEYDKFVKGYVACEKVIHLKIRITFF